MLALGHQVLEGLRDLFLDHRLERRPAERKSALLGGDKVAVVVVVVLLLGPVPLLAHCSLGRLSTSKLTLENLDPGLEACDLGIQLLGGVLVLLELLGFGLH